MRLEIWRMCWCKYAQYIHNTYLFLQESSVGKAGPIHRPYFFDVISSLSLISFSFSSSFSFSFSFSFWEHRQTDTGIVICAESFFNYLDWVGVCWDRRTYYRTVPYKWATCMERAWSGLELSYRYLCIISSCAWYSTSIDQSSIFTKLTKIRKMKDRKNTYYSDVLHLRFFSITPSPMYERWTVPFALEWISFFLIKAYLGQFK